MSVKDNGFDKKNAPAKTFWDECDYMILWNQEAPEGMPAWDDLRKIAKILNAKFPRTDVLSLTDAKLLEMMSEAGILQTLPEIIESEKKDRLFALKCALSRVIEGDEDYDAHQHDADKKFDMGYRYYYGEGVEQDYSKAALLYMEAAEQGHAGAQCNLGACYYCGKGTEQDNEQATHWLKKAAGQGNTEAMFYLAMLYEEACEAEKQREGLLWLILAAQQGDREAKKSLSEMHLDYTLVDMKEGELIALAEQGEIKGLADYGVRYTVDAGASVGAVRLKLKKLTKTPLYSHLRSHFGDQPYFEEGEEWPRTKSGNGLDFVFQIFNTDNFGLPGNIKLIQFFYNFDKMPWSAKEDGWFIKVYEHIDMDNAVFIETPEECWEKDYCEIEFESISPSEKRSFYSHAGGQPVWLQGNDSPKNKGFQFLFQIASEDEAGLMWSDMGTVYAFYNPGTKETWFTLQSH